MFKDYDKYLKASVKVYIFVLIIIFILKLTGIDYFGLDTNNSIVVSINNIANKYNLINIWYFITLYIYTYFIVSITCDNKKLKLKSLIYTIIGVIVKIIEKRYCHTLSVLLIDILYIYLVCLITNKKYKLKDITKRNFKYIFLTIFYQFISMIVRVNSVNNYNYSFIQFILLDLDYIILCLLTHKIYFESRGENKCTMEVGSYLQKKKNLKILLKKLHTSYSNFKKQDKKYKAEIIIYFILSLIWNILAVILVLFIAKLNDTLIECIFILMSFWITKKTFGKAFHFKKMTTCFIVSNITYYVLNRITTPLGISIIVPIMLGVALSYFTSKLVKKVYKPLYKGMTKELFDETILKVTDKDNLKYKICYDYFVNKKSAITLNGHITAVIDGVVIDTFYPKGIMRCAWKIK